MPKFFTNLILSSPSQSVRGGEKLWHFQIISAKMVDFSYKFWGCSGLPKEQRRLLPVLEHVADNSPRSSSIGSGLSGPAGCRRRRSPLCIHILGGTLVVRFTTNRRAVLATNRWVIGQEQALASRGSGSRQLPCLSWAPHLPDARAQRLLQPPGRRRTAEQQASGFQAPWLATKHSVATMGIEPWATASGSARNPDHRRPGS